MGSLCAGLVYFVFFLCLHSHVRVATLYEALIVDTSIPKGKMEHNLLRTQSAKNTIFAFAKTFTIFYLKIYNFKVKVRLILT